MRKQIIITIAVMTLVAGGLTGGVWYFMNQDANGVKATLENQKAQLEARIKDLLGSSEDSDKECCGLNDKEMIMVEAHREGGYGGNLDSVIFPDKITIDGDWALVSFLPISFSEQSGYEIPGMGGLSYVMEKTDDCDWERLGSITEGGIDSDVRARLNDIPKSIVSDDMRGEPL